MFLQELDERGCDAHGCGHYGASRINHTHKGVDLCIPPYTPVQCGFDGTVIKVGYPYRGAAKSHIRYVAVKFDDTHQQIMEEIYGNGLWHCRVFYVKPIVYTGDLINWDTIIGDSQKLGGFYDGITEHVHFELYTLIDDTASEHNKLNFDYVNPDDFLDYVSGGF